VDKKQKEEFKKRLMKKFEPHLPLIGAYAEELVNHAVKVAEDMKLK